MTEIVFFLEEPSAREMLKGLLPKVLPENISVQYIVFEGKQDLGKKLPIRLRAWQKPDSRFVVLCDKDSADCHQVKESLVEKCNASGKPETLVRIACHELESWYLGDLAAVANSIGPGNLERHQNKNKFRAPDQLANPVQELKKIAPSYQKVAGSRAIGPNLSLSENCSVSFNVFLSGLKNLIANGAPA